MTRHVDEFEFAQQQLHSSSDFYDDDETNNEERDLEQQQHSNSPGPKSNDYDVDATDDEEIYFEQWKSEQIEEILDAMTLQEAMIMPEQTDEAKSTIGLLRNNTG